MNTLRILIGLYIALALVSCKNFSRSASTDPLVGDDRDSHGCIRSAGYIWSEVQGDCIRLWERGIRTESTDDTQQSVYLVFAPDSSRVELFFSNGNDNEILHRRTLPSGISIWRTHNYSSKIVKRNDSMWTISLGNQVIYCSATNSPGIGEMVQETFTGLIPAASGPGIEYTLVIRHPRHCGNGTFDLNLNYRETGDGKDRAFSYTGKHITLRGTPDDDNAIVDQCISHDGKHFFNFLREGDDRLTLLDSDFHQSKTGLNYTLRRVK